MNVKEIKELVDLVARRGLSSLEIERAGFRIRIEGPRPESPPARRGQLGPPAAASEPAAEILPPPHALPAPGGASPSRPAAQEEGLSMVTSPIVGTFYRAPNPDAEPFVKVGDQVEKGATLCIVEAMKLMNEIEADVGGMVVEIFPKNGQPVEYGEKLFAIRPA